MCLVVSHAHNTASIVARGYYLNIKLRNPLNVYNDLEFNIDYDLEDYLMVKHIFFNSTLFFIAKLIKNSNSLRCQGQDQAHEQGT